ERLIDQLARVQRPRVAVEAAAVSLGVADALEVETQRGNAARCPATGRRHPHAPLSDAPMCAGVQEERRERRARARARLDEHADQAPERLLDRDRRFPQENAVEGKLDPL